MQVSKLRLVVAGVAASICAFSISASESLVETGEQQAAVCKACHQVTPDGIAIVGPPLWGIAERNIASFPGFGYSDALKAQSGSWDEASLDAFLASPSTFAPGTNMVFPGVENPDARKAIIAWLATKNDIPANWYASESAVEVKPLGDGILVPDDNMALVAASCSSCHSLHLVVQQGLSKESWDETLEWMVDEQGMDPLEPEDHEKVLVYLATHYGD
ncbi:c-type cytochrome [Enterovibrio coralii]|uniref:Cytochrome C n=1 Tax=Enterovibrio coralii TaxID=294935 RepID=A0A135I9E3_9GAMM|nr:c-type cytochrome [Enterovibrio coralii]KXF82076.1 cytochrome C [Enterovibrio coralii]